MCSENFRNFRNQKTLSGKNLPSARTIEEDLDAMTQKWEAAQRELNAMRERLAAVEEEHNEAMQKCRAAEEEAHVYRQAAGVPRHCTSAAVPRTPSHANALLTPVQAPNSESRQQNSEAPNSESRWQNLKNIQSGDKWFKVPDLAAFSESTRKAQQALLAAEEESEDREHKPEPSDEPWGKSTALTRVKSSAAARRRGAIVIVVVVVVVVDSAVCRGGDGAQE